MKFVSPQFNAIPMLVGSVIGNGQKDVTTASTSEILLTATATMAVLIKAKADNTGDIYVGNSGVDSSNGYILDAGEAVAIGVDHNSSNIYIDASVSGEGVSYLTLV